MLDLALLLTDQAYVLSVALQAIAEGMAIGAGMLALTLVYRGR
jgi:hypothetical protein